MEFESSPADYRGRRVTVMGLGSFGGGVGAVRFLAERGARVLVTDTRTETQLGEALADLADCPRVEFRLGEHCEQDFRNADLIVVNPAVKRDNPFLRIARRAGVPLTSEMNLFWRHNPASVVAVTGSNGKSTTTALTHAILQQTGRRCRLGGNIGRSLLPMVDQIEPSDWVVLELSSFQLEDLDRLHVSPQLAVVTNFSPNHLDWHGTLDAYRHAKQTILRWQSSTDIAVLNSNDADVCRWPVRGRRLLCGESDPGSDGVFRRGRDLIVRLDGRETSLPIASWLTLPGEHNLQNAAMATCAAMALGASPDAVRRGLENYVPLPHRLQFVAEVQGRRFYNDSLATTPESTLVALDAFTAPIILLAGGYDKQVDLSAMARGIAEKAKAVVLMGQTGEPLRRLIERASNRRAKIATSVKDFHQAFAVAWAASAPGDVILLSPGCASYDWFRNFADRGEQFVRLVGELRERRAA